MLTSNFSDADDPFIDHLKSLSPAAADLEIRSLTSGGGAHLAAAAPGVSKADGGGNEFVLFISALTDRLRKKRDYELVQAWMAVFLRLHGSEIFAGSTAAAVAVASEGMAGDGTTALQLLPAPGGGGGPAQAPMTEVVRALREWRREQDQEAARLAALTGYCSGVVGFLRSAV